MTIVAVCAASGSAAATTTATLLSAMLPEGYPTLLAECDPSGGDVAAWAQLPTSPGWSTAVSGADRSWAAVADNTQQLPSGLRLMAAPARATQAHTAVGEAAREFAGLLAAAPDVVTIADCGRVDFGAPVWTGGAPYRSSEIAGALGAELFGVLPEDASGAALVAGGWTVGKRASRSPLAKAAATLGGRVIEAIYGRDHRPDLLWTAEATVGS
jgi:hypothetical protein